MLARTHRILPALLALTALLGPGAVAARANDAPLAARFAQTLRGDVRAVGNTLMTCPASARTCTAARNRTATGSALNNDYDMGFVDTDGDAATFDSSSADLSLPAGATVVWAGLYWGADTSAGEDGSAGSAAARGQVRLKVPGATSYRTVTASPADVLTSSTSATRYRAFSDVTALLPASGSGRFWVANVQAGTGIDRYAGWALIVAYRDPSQGIRRVNVFDGLATVGSGRPAAASIGPLFTPAAGSVRTNTGLLAFDGDAGLVGETVAFDGRAISDALNPADNVMNSTISANGAPVTAKNPDYANQLGLDLDSTVTSGMLGNARSSAPLTFGSVNETFYAAAFWLVSDESPAVNTSRPAVSGTARDGSVLTAAPGGWAGTPAITYAYEWQRCDTAGSGCTAVPGATAAAYTLTGAETGGTVRAVVTASNAAGSSAPAASGVTATIAKRPPASASLPVVSGVARDGEALASTLGTWTGTGPLDYATRWLRCDAAGNGCAAIPGATGGSYAVTAADVGHALRSEVSAANDAGLATARSAATKAVVAAPPALDGVVPELSGSARERELLSATTGRWRGTAPLAFAYRWERCSASGTGCAAIAGATTSGYTLTPDDVDRTVRVAVTASNPAGSALARSAVSALIAAAPARNVAPPAITGPDAKRDMHADAGRWEGTLGALAHQWRRCDTDGAGCADIAGATSATYALTDEDAGHALRVAVTMTNAGGATTAVSAATTRIPVAPPVNLVPPRVGGSPLRGSALKAIPGVWHAPGTVRVAQRWLRCDAAGAACAPIAGAEAPAYTPVAADVGRSLRVSLTLSNESGSASATSPPTESIAEPPPATPAAQPPAGGIGGVAGDTSAHAPGLADVPGSLVADAACQVLRGTREQQATLPGIGVVVVRATTQGPATPAAPLRLSTSARGRLASVRYALDGRPLAGSGAHATATPAQLGAPGRHDVTVTLRGRSGGTQTLSLSLHTRACDSRFTATRSRSALRLRADARRALTGVDFALPAGLLPRQSRSARPIGTLRLLVAGESGPREIGLVLPAAGAAPRLLGNPAVRYAPGGLRVSGLPAGTASVELALARTAALDGAMPRGALRLRATLQWAGARPKTLVLRLG